MNALFLILTFVLINTVNSSSFEYGPELAVVENREVSKYLKNFGYLPNSARHSRGNNKIGLKRLQQFFNLPVTGRPDAETLELIKQPRCGFSDFNSNTSRFELLTSGLSDRDIMYSIGRYSSKLSNSYVDDNIALALEIWAKYAFLKFTKVDEDYHKVHIRFGFMPTDHNDGHPFDGPGGVLAHAIVASSRGGEVHYDETENWAEQEKRIIFPPKKVDFFSVTLHEIGHVLGLAHSNVYESVMFPIYRYFEKNNDLYEDDINGIKYIYRTRRRD